MHVSDRFYVSKSFNRYRYLVTRGNPDEEEFQVLLNLYQYNDHASTSDEQYWRVKAILYGDQARSALTLRPQQQVDVEGNLSYAKERGYCNYYLNVDAICVVPGSTGAQEETDLEAAHHKA